MGVWIETPCLSWLLLKRSSLPAWECGLKLLATLPPMVRRCVTPRVGVWIETFIILDGQRRGSVTPRVGVWIETLKKCLKLLEVKSLPAWECGLKQKRS